MLVVIFVIMLLLQTLLFAPLFLLHHGHVFLRLFVSPSYLKLCIHVTGNTGSCQRRAHLHVRVVRPSGTEIQERYWCNET